MDPIVTTSLADGIIWLGKIALDKVAEKAGVATKECASKYWEKAKALLGLAADPGPDKLDDTVRKAIDNAPEATEQLRQVLEDYNRENPGQLVGSIKVGKGVVSVVHSNTGTINTNTNFQ